MPPKKIDLNSDVGESFGRYTIGLDDEVIPLISSANIACGYHAGDPAVMKKTIALAKANGVGAGAHPGFPDLMGFGRRNMDITLAELKEYVAYQVGALQGFATMAGIRLQHVKPHGALYNMAVNNPDMWDAVAEVVAAIDDRLILFVLGGANREDLKAIGDRWGIRVAFEFFADRAYTPQGTLVPRSLPGAVFNDPNQAARQVLTMVTEGKVVCIDGTEIPLSGDTVCVHGDNPAALNLVRHIRDTLTDAGVEIQPVGEFI